MRGSLEVQIELPAEHKLNDTAPSHLEWRPASESIVLAPEHSTVDLVGTDGTVPRPRGIVGWPGRLARRRGALLLPGRTSAALPDLHSYY